MEWKVLLNERFSVGINSVNMEENVEWFWETDWGESEKLSYRMRTEKWHRFKIKFTPSGRNETAHVAVRQPANSVNFVKSVINLLQLICNYYSFLSTKNCFLLNSFLSIIIISSLRNWIWEKSVKKLSFNERLKKNWLWKCGNGKSCIVSSRKVN